MTGSGYIVQVPDSGTVALGGSKSGPYGMGASGPLPGPAPIPNEGDFVNVAHSLWTLLFAAQGGCFAYWLHKTGQERTTPRTASP